MEKSPIFEMLVNINKLCLFEQYEGQKSTITPIKITWGPEPTIMPPLIT